VCKSIRTALYIYIYIQSSQEGQRHVVKVALRSGKDSEEGDGIQGSLVSFMGVEQGGMLFYGMTCKY